MAKAKKDMTPAQKAAARVPEPAAQPAAAKHAPAKPDPHERRKRFGLLVGGLALLLVVALFSWLMNYSHETDAAKAAMEPTAQMQVDDESGWIAFGDATASRGYILYPGAKVAAQAYAPLARELAESGTFCVIAKMPFNLAVLDAGAAAGIMEAFPQVGAWYIGGHSLGGAVACQWAASNPEAEEGIILLASYSPDDLSSTGLRVLSVYGSNDGVMNAQAYEDALALMPDDFTEVVIEGGNHAQFGEYGSQGGDGEATIPAQEQRDQTVEAITEWMAAA